MSDHGLIATAAAGMGDAVVTRRKPGSPGSSRPPAESPANGDLFFGEKPCSTSHLSEATPSSTAAGKGGFGCQPIIHEQHPGLGATGDFSGQRTGGCLIEPTT